MVVFGALGCILPVAGFVFSHCQCFTSTKTVKGSWSDDFLQVLSLSRLFPCPFLVHVLSFTLIYDFTFDRELSKKAQKANNLWWRLSGLLGDQNRLFMYIVLQALFTVATMALTVPIFLSYELHVVFQILKVSATVWNGGSFLLEVMPRQVILKEKKKSEVQPTQTQTQLDQSPDHGEDANSSVEACQTCQS